MVTVEQVDITNKKQVSDFIFFPFKLYEGCKQWVPPFISDIKTMMDPKKHPFYEHSEADFFLARRNGEVVGRIAALENKPFNKYHQTKEAVFYLYDVVDDQEVTNQLFDRVFDWAKGRNLDTFIGPKGFSSFDGYGIQIQGFEHRQMMIMMNYNYDYYPVHMEKLGFEKEVDFVSCYVNKTKFIIPERIKEIARRVEERGIFKVVNFNTKKELVKWAGQIGEAYNRTFVKNWEYYPLTDREIKFVVDSIITIADPRLIKIITHDDDVVGFLFAFQDCSAALQRQKGRITPWGLIDIYIDLKRTKWVSLNGAGVIPEFWGRGGNALLYCEMEKTISQYSFEHAELTQVAETTKQMRADLQNVGGEEYKNHRVYHRKI